MCSAIPSAPVKFVARLRLTLLYSVIFVLRALPRKHRVCAVLFLWLHKVSYTLLLRFSQNFVLRVLPHKHPVCAVLLLSLPSSLLHACVYFALFGNFLLCLFGLTDIRLVQCFSLQLTSSLHPFGFLCFIWFAFVTRALPNKLRFVL